MYDSVCFNNLKVCVCLFVCFCAFDCVCECVVVTICHRGTHTQRLRLSERLLQISLTLRERLNGAHHPLLATTYADLANTYHTSSESSASRVLQVLLGARLARPCPVRSSRCQL
jgi:hypothetical protein